LHAGSLPKKTHVVLPPPFNIVARRKRCYAMAARARNGTDPLSHYHDFAAGFAI
jgi:hypothetical protein